MVLESGSLEGGDVRVRYALVRAVPDSFPRCLKRPGTRDSIDVLRAREQHAGFVAALRGAGAVVDVLSAPEECPDAPFLGDRIVLCGRHAIVTRSAVASRAGELVGLDVALRSRAIVHAMPPGATLDGGDVLVIGRRLYVAHSSRTNAEGIRYLERMAALAQLRVETLEVRGALQLGSLCSYLGDGTLLTAAGEVPRAAFADLDRIETPEPWAANVLAAGSTLIVPAEAQRTIELLRRTGRNLSLVPLSEFLKGNGGPRCLAVTFAE